MCTKHECKWQIVCMCMFQEPFVPQACGIALAERNQYGCGANLFMADVFSSSSKGVPIRKQGVEDMVKFDYPEDEDPHHYDGTVVVALDKASVDVLALSGKLPLLSPEESVHAPLLACARDIAKGATEDRVQKWRTFFLSVSFKFVVVPAEDRFFKAVNARNKICSDYAALARTCFQEVVEINLYKERMERTQGKTYSAQMLCELYNKSMKRAECQDEVSITFVDNALTLWSRAFVHKEVLQAVQRCDEEYGHKTVFDHVTKLITIVYKAKVPENMLWCFLAIEDNFRYGIISGMSVRDLQGKSADQHGKGIVDDLVYQKDFLQWYRDDFIPAQSSIPTKHRDLLRDVIKDHATFRDHCGCRSSSGEFGFDPDLTWQAGFSAATLKVLELVEDTIWRFCYLPPPRSRRSGLCSIDGFPHNAPTGERMRILACFIDMPYTTMTRV